MAKSVIKFGVWRKEFSVSEFSLFWLILESVLEESEVARGAESLDFRLKTLIEEGCLGDEWYHVTELDEIIQGDCSRFEDLLAKAIRHVTNLEAKDFWASLKRSEQAHEVGCDRFGDPPNRDALIGLIVRFSLPWFSPPESSQLMKAVGWRPTAKFVIQK